MNARKTKWQKVGEINVDAGLCWIGDPCYCVTPDAKSHPAKTWDEFCDRLEDSGVTQWDFYPGSTGLGVSVESGYGDGLYPVEVRRAEDGKVAEVRIRFIR